MNQPNALRVGMVDAAVLTSKHEMKQSFVSTDTDLASSEPFQMKKAQTGFDTEDSLMLPLVNSSHNDQEGGDKSAILNSSK